MCLYLLLLSFFVRPSFCLMYPSNYMSNSLSNYNIEITDFDVIVPLDAVVLFYLPIEYPAVTLFRNKPYTGNDPAIDYCPVGRVPCTSVVVDY